MKYLKIAIVTLVLASRSAFAAPIYLDCKSLPDHTHVFSVTLGEERNNITHITTNGSFKANGFYTADEITYKDVKCTKSFCVTKQNTINRNNLSFIYIWYTEVVDKDLGIEPPESIILSGICSIVQASDKKI